MERTLEELVRAAVRRDADAFTQLISQFERPALAVAYAWAGRSDIAGEIVQEAFLRAWERLAGLKQPERFGPWLIEIVRNLAADARRRRPVTSAAIDPQLADASLPSPLDFLAARETSRRLREAMDQLDPISRSAVVLRYFDGQSSREIARLLNLTPAAVDMRLSRARRVLRGMLASQLETRP